MASSSGLLNLDNLISGNDNDDNVLQISQDVESQSDREIESGSDSSYGKFTKKMAQNMDQMIAEVKLNKEEKDKRVASARNQKAKEQEEKQKAFGKSSKKFSGKKGFFSKSLDCDKIRKTKDPKILKSTVKDAESVDQKNDSIVKPKKPQRTKKKSLVNDSQQVEEVKKVCKMKNITVQDFDIDSTPSSSSDEVDLISYSKVIDNYQRSFKVKSLNRVINDGDSGSSDSDDENSQPIKQRFHHSAEKSAAAQRRKRSNYLKKRHTNFRPNKSENQPEAVDKSSNNQEVIDTEAVLRNKPLNPHKDKKTKKEPVKDTNNVAEKVETKRTLKIILPSRKTNQQKNTSEKPHSSNKSDKSYRSKDVNVREKKDPDKDPNSCSKDKQTYQKNKKDIRTLHNSTTSTNQEQSSTDKEIETKILKSNQSIKNDIFKYSSSDESIEVVKTSKIVNDVEKSELFKFERSPRSSENEIDWKAVEELKVKNLPPQRKVESGDDIEIDFNEIIKSRNPVKLPIETKKVNVRQSDSSSDFEAQFDACLVKFNKLK